MPCLRRHTNFTFKFKTSSVCDPNFAQILGMPSRTSGIRRATDAALVLSLGSQPSATGSRSFSMKYRIIDLDVFLPDPKTVKKKLVSVLLKAMSKKLKVVLVLRANVSSARAWRALAKSVGVSISGLSSFND